MANRPSGPSTRSKKSSSPTLPPVTTVSNQEQAHADAEAVDNRAADGVVGESPASDDVHITRSTLQQRELPSLSESRETRIAERAYWRAERRGFAPGHELDDWLDAEQEIDSKQSD